MTNRPGEEDGTFIQDIVTVKMNASVSMQIREVQRAHADMAQFTGANTSVSGSQKTESSPSTPSQQLQTTSVQPSSPSASQPTREGSPRSQNSESSHTIHASRRPARGCKFETGMARARRRVPYSLGPDKLDMELDERRKTLGLVEEERLTRDVQELYSCLVPTLESEERRNIFVRKLESLLQSRWPGQLIKVSVFGSTGNRLGTSDSDVDICITTDCKELERVCSIAELLDQNGMERVVCVSSAKVPIVKAWDPELQVACDINVNNPIALENTQMIRSYTTIDDRFRPLAMIVKHWAKRRILNDAALGGTLSSYTWICMVLNFLQTRDPPVLPSLQQKSDLVPKILNGVDVAFDKNIEDYRDFGARNTSSLGQLLFGFFRFFGHEFDFEENAISIRLGKVVPKSQKAWHLLQDNRLCVEEPFNTSRNLANTADDTSMRGIHLELRRAFKLIADGHLDFACQQYEARPEERKHTEAFIHPTARPIIPQAPTQPAAQTHRNNRSGYRGGKQSNRNAGRRASNPPGRNSTYLRDLPFQMTPQELQLQAQHQQHLLHDQLYQQYQYLQFQEQELRMQLYQQGLRSRGLMSGQPSSQSTFGNGSTNESPNVHPSGTPLRMPVSPGVFQSRFSLPSPFLRNSTPASGIMTNPASPLLGAVAPDGRRFTRRTSVTGSSPAGSLRAHSQPARTLPFGGGFSLPRHSHEGHPEYSDLVADRRSSVAMHPQMFGTGYTPHAANVSGALYEAGRRPVEYMGYYVGQSPSLPASLRNTAVSPMPLHAGLAIQNGGLSPKLSSRSSRLPSVASSPSLQSANLEDASESTASAEYPNEYHTAPESSKSPKQRSGPLIVDSSMYSPQRRRPAVRASLGRNHGVTLSASTSDDPGLDTPSSSDEQYPDYPQLSAVKYRSQNNTDASVNGLSDRMSVVSVTPQSHLTALDVVEKSMALNEVSKIPTYDDRPASSLLADSDNKSFPATVEIIQTGPGNKKKKQKADRVSPARVESLAGLNTPLAARTNGQDSGSVSPATVKHPDALAGWQTQKKKKRPKKSTRAEEDASLLNNTGGEILPLDESLRKGG